ncbi:MAG: PTS sugar transporter subunit IIA [Phycisphaerales bacterium]|nr:PTS sugar transporter subunit IIA [Phycisphaerales bacterium]
MSLTPLLQPGTTLVLSGPASRDDALRTAAEHAHRALIPSISADELLALLIQRESKSSTSVPEGVAFPHAIDPRITTTALIVTRWRTPVEFSASSRPDLIFTMFGSSEEPWRHVRLLARLARIIRAPGALGRLRAAEDGEQLRAALLREDESHD